jgi:regulator of protease activity HflC (stomatin/prohibitin superfamily)
MGIDNLIQIVAILFFVVGFAGVAMIVIAASRGNNVGRGIMLAAVGFVLGVIFMFISSGMLVVGPTESAVTFNPLNPDALTVRDTGIHVIVPGIEEVYLYDVSQQTYTMSSSSNEGSVSGDDAVRARSVDGQEVLVDMTVIFNIDPENVSVLHRNWPQRNYVDGFIRPTVRSIVRDVIAVLQAEEIYGGSRDAMQADILSDLVPLFEAQGLNLTSALVRDINFSQAFIDAIEAKQVEEQALERAETAAQRARTEARGEADAAIETARGEGEAIRIRAAAEAEALRLVSEQIAANPNLIQYLYVTTLSDNINIALVPSSSPFLFDASTFTQMDDDFVAPTVPDRETSEPETESGD